MKKYFKKLVLRLFVPLFAILWFTGFFILIIVSLLLWIPLGNIAFDNNIVEWFLEEPYNYFKQL